MIGLTAPVYPQEIMNFSTLAFHRRRHKTKRMPVAGAVMPSISGRSNPPVAAATVRAFYNVCYSVTFLRPHCCSASQPDIIRWVSGDLQLAVNVNRHPDHYLIDLFESGNTAASVNKTAPPACWLALDCAHRLQPSTTAFAPAL